MYIRGVGHKKPELGDSVIELSCIESNIFSLFARFEISVILEIVGTKNIVIKTANVVIKNIME